MEREELLKRFNELLDTYEQHKAYGDKAREQASNFSSAVIEKVMADHQIKASLIADDISPLVPQVMAEVTTLAAAIGDAEQSKGDFGARIEELELRKVIGEISDEDFETMTAEGRGTVDSADQQISELDSIRLTIQSSLERWTEMSGGAIEQDDGDIDRRDPVVDSILPGFEEDGDSVEIESDDLVGFDLEEAADPVDIIDDGAAYVAAVEVEVEQDAGASLNDDSGEDEPIAGVSAEEEADVFDDEPSEDDDSDDGVEEDADDGVDDEAVDSADDEGDDAANDVHDIGVDVSEEGSESDVADDGPRRAILLSNEGTPDEQIYALTGEVFTVGRGRDNDLQIKNDSKVSRFHCKLYRRGSNYYLEDNKSSNGTMVNGELISERRLFGGEEVVIGETFFRFRVM
jgi:hypothetical protein